MAWIPPIRFHASIKLRYLLAADWNLGRMSSEVIPELTDEEELANFA